MNIKYIIVSVLGSVLCFESVLADLVPVNPVGGSAGTTTGSSSTIFLPEYLLVGVAALIVVVSSFVVLSRIRNNKWQFSFYILKIFF